MEAAAATEAAAAKTRTVFTTLGHGDESCPGCLLLNNIPDQLKSGILWLGLWGVMCVVSFETKSERQQRIKCQRY